MTYDMEDGAMKFNFDPALQDPPPLAVAELFDTRLGPLVGILVAGLALVAAAVALTRRGRR